MLPLFNDLALMMLMPLTMTMLMMVMTLVMVVVMLILKNHLVYPLSLFNDPVSQPHDCRKVTDAPGKKRSFFTTSPKFVKMRFNENLSILPVLLSASPWFALR